MVRDFHFFLNNHCGYLYNIKNSCEALSTFWTQNHSGAEHIWRTVIALLIAFIFLPNTGISCFYHLWVHLSKDPGTTGWWERKMSQTFVLLSVPDLKTLIRNMIMKNKICRYSQSKGPNSKQNIFSWASYFAPSP